ncbi:MAG: cyanophycin synthetase [Arhodomonas sp.]|nr:cyanophycin synthetase [Arhodomonas sp.]
MALTLHIDDAARGLRVPLFGAFNVANVLATAGAALALGHDVDDLVTALGRLRPVPGRMEALGGGEGPTVIVDYAHTPAALEAALAATRAGICRDVSPCGRLRR